MQFYLKPLGGPRCLFAIRDPGGHRVYEVTGKTTPFGNQFFLFDKEHRLAGRSSGVRLSGVSRYSVLAGKKRLLVTIGSPVSRQPVRIRGKRWYFRGSLLTRSFDLLDEASQTVMTHGRCWEQSGNCYAVEISKPEDVPLCLCLSVLIDCTILGGHTLPVPAGG